MVGCKEKPAPSSDSSESHNSSSDSDSDPDQGMDQLRKYFVETLGFFTKDKKTSKHKVRTNIYSNEYSNATIFFCIPGLRKCKH